MIKNKLLFCPIPIGDDRNIYEDSGLVEGLENPCRNRNLSARVIFGYVFGKVPKRSLFPFFEVRLISNKITPFGR